MTTNIRQRFNRKTAALFLAFALAFSGTGLASLALLQDDVQVNITATATTIDFQVNGVSPFSIDFGLVERGDIHYVPLHLTNSGTGWVNIDNIDLTPVTNGQEISTSSKTLSYINVAPANCNPAGGINPNAAAWAAAPLVEASELSSASAIVINAGDFYDICTVWQVGGDASLGEVTAGNTLFSVQYNLHGYYP